MHIIGLIIAVATAIFWVSRAARGAQDVANFANDVRNMPRRNRFRKKAAKRGIDLIDDPVEAATILMVSVARLSDYSSQSGGLLSGESISKIVNIIQSYMKLSAKEADEMLTQMRWTVQDLVQPESALAPMTDILKAGITMTEAEDLSDMLHKVSHADGQANNAQNAFVERFRERTGLSV